MIGPDNPVEAVLVGERMHRRIAEALECTCITHVLNTFSQA